MCSTMQIIFSSFITFFFYSYCRWTVETLTITTNVIVEVIRGNRDVNRSKVTIELPNFVLILALSRN